MIRSVRRLAILAMLAGVAAPPGAARAESATTTDTLAAGNRISRRLHLRERRERWANFVLRDSAEVVTGSTERQITARVSRALRGPGRPARTTWEVVTVRRRADGALASSDTVVLVRRGGWVVLRHRTQALRDSAFTDYSLGERLTGWVDPPGDAPLAPIDRRVAPAPFPDSFREALAATLPLAVGRNFEIAAYDVWSGEAGTPRTIAAHVVGRERLPFAGGPRETWRLDLDRRDGSGDTLRLWIERRSRRLLRLENHRADGSLFWGMTALE